MDKRMNSKHSLVNILERKINEKDDDRSGPEGLLEKIIVKIEELQANRKANKERQCKKSTNS